MDAGVFERHQQALLAARLGVGQVVMRGVDARVEELLERFALAEQPGIAESGASDQHAIHACHADALRRVVQALDVAVAEDERVSLAHDLGCCCYGIPVGLTLVVLRQRAPMQGDNSRLKLQQFLHPIGNHDGVDAQACLDRDGQQTPLDVRVIAPDSHAVVVHLPDMRDALRVHLQVFQRLPVGPVAHTLLCSADNLLRRLRYANQRRASTFIGDGARRAAHVDVHAVETKLADDVCRFVEVFWAAAEDLRHDRPLRWRIQEVAEDAITAAP